MVNNWHKDSAWGRKGLPLSLFLAPQRSCAAARRGEIACTPWDSVRTSAVNPSAPMSNATSSTLFVLHPFTKCKRDGAWAGMGQQIGEPGTRGPPGGDPCRVRVTPYSDIVSTVTSSPRSIFPLLISVEPRPNFAILAGTKQPAQMATLRLHTVGASHPRHPAAAQKLYRRQLATLVAMTLTVAASPHPRVL